MKGSSQELSPSAGERTRSAPSPQGWLESGQYLPDFMRDFHDQKDLFKALDEVVQRRSANDSYTRDLSWITAQVYTVDVFLWVLARHGYTLQRSRQRLRFSDIHTFVGAAVARAREASAAVLREAFNRPTPDGAERVHAQADPHPVLTPNPLPKEPSL